MSEKTDDKSKRNSAPKNGPIAGMIGEKPKDFKKSVGKLIKSLAPHKIAIIATLILAVASTAFSIVSPKILGEMTNQIVKDLMAKQMGFIAEFDYASLARTALMLIGLYILATICNYLSGWILARVTQRVMLNYRRDISQKINRLPISYFDKHQYGDTLSRVTNDVDTIAQTLSQSLADAVASVAMIVGILTMMFTISWQMTLIALAVLPISAGLVGVITKRTQKHFKNQQDELGELNGHIEEIYAGQTVIKAFSGEPKVEKKFSGINYRLYGSSWKSQFFSGLMFPIMNFVSNLGYVASAVLGGWLAINGKISIGDIQAFIQYVSQFNQPIVEVAQIATVLQSTVAAAERVFEFLEEPEEDDSGHVEISAIKGAVEFQNVSFSYEPDRPVINNFSATIKPGQKVAIVGPTGAGKTTIVNLLMRFYDPSSGKILIDGIDTKTLSRSTVRHQFGMVLQDTWLFDGSIMANLVYGKTGASEEDVKRAARSAHVAHFVESLPHGFGTKIDGDAEIVSAGEKQLLTIARAMVADAPMMILDEATSSVDTRTEGLIQEAMERLTKGRTSFIIAHRLSTIRDADLILVMKNGNIVEQGSHSELMKKGGFYEELYNSQFAED